MSRRADHPATAGARRARWQAFPGPLRDQLVAAILTGRAQGEGEGYASVTEWRAGHEQFWRSYRTEGSVVELEA
jgi:hypothetical protein